MKRLPVLVTVAALGLAGVSGWLASSAFSVGQQATRTVTINVATGPTGARGPTGPAGPEGPAGGAQCPAGFEPADVVIDHPGGHITLYTCAR